MSLPASGPSGPATGRRPRRPRGRAGRRAPGRGPGPSAPRRARPPAGPGRRGPAPAPRPTGRRRAARPAPRCPRRGQGQDQAVVAPGRPDEPVVPDAARGAPGEVVGEEPGGRHPRGRHAGGGVERGGIGHRAPRQPGQGREGRRRAPLARHVGERAEEGAVGPQEAEGGAAGRAGQQRDAIAGRMPGPGAGDDLARQGDQLARVAPREVEQLDAGAAAAALEALLADEEEPGAVGGPAEVDEALVGGVRREGVAAPAALAVALGQPELGHAGRLGRRAGQAGGRQGAREVGDAPAVGGGGDRPVREGRAGATGGAALVDDPELPLIGGGQRQGQGQPAVGEEVGTGDLGAGQGQADAPRLGPVAPELAGERGRAPLGQAYPVGDVGVPGEAQGHPVVAGGEVQGGGGAAAFAALDQDGGTGRATHHGEGAGRRLRPVRQGGFAPGGEGAGGEGRRGDRQQREEPGPGAPQVGARRRLEVDVEWEAHRRVLARLARPRPSGPADRSARSPPTLAAPGDPTGDTTVTGR